MGQFRRDGTAMHCGQCGHIIGQLPPDSRARLHHNLRLRILQNNIVWYARKRAATRECCASSKRRVKLEALSADMPHDALSLLLTGTHANKHKRINIQRGLRVTKQQKGNDHGQNSKSEAQPVVPSRDPLEVITRYPRARRAFRVL